MTWPQRIYDALTRFGPMTAARMAMVLQVPAHQVMTQLATMRARRVIQVIGRVPCDWASQPVQLYALTPGATRPRDGRAVVQAVIDPPLPPEPEPVRERLETRVLRTFVQRGIEHAVVWDGTR